MHGFHTLLTLTGVVVQGFLLIKAFEILRELQAIRRLQESRPAVGTKFPQIHSAIGRPRPNQSDTNLQAAVPVAYAVWAWRGTNWELELGTVPHGYEVSNPPGFSGVYSGQRVKTECVRC